MKKCQMKSNLREKNNHCYLVKFGFRTDFAQKKEIADQINYLIKKKKLIQLEASKKIGIDRYKLYQIKKNELFIFTLEQLKSYLDKLKCKDK